MTKKELDEFGFQLLSTGIVLPPSIKLTATVDFTEFGVPAEHRHMVYLEYRHSPQLKFQLKNALHEKRSTALKETNVPGRGRRALSREVQG